MQCVGLARCGTRVCRGDHPLHEEDAMRLGHAWRAAVLASLALLVSGQLCMITTCVPRLVRVAEGAHAAHACCGSEGRAATPSAPMPAGHAMPCDQQIPTVDAPSLDHVPASIPVAVLPFVVTPADAPAPVHAFLEVDDVGPPHERTLPATAGLRAPPQG